MKRTVNSYGRQCIRRRHVRTLSAISSMQQRHAHRAAVALGSNMGDRIGNIENALAKMRQKFSVLQVSPLYETKPMYYEDQDSFINGACEVETNLDPIGLLDALQAIENDLGRKRTVDKGPRPIDLDVLLYDQEQVDHQRLEVPHKLMHEREFVLRPLADILPNAIVPPQPPHSSPSTVADLYHRLSNLDKSMSPVTHLTPSLPLLRSTDPSRSTAIMAILNLTPDSFSDGGLHPTDSDDLSPLLTTVQTLISHGATILDIGGQSTRPNAPSITATEELKRILPAIHAIRTHPSTAHIAISIDTFHASVAREAIAAGADIINDISAGLLDPQMLSTVAQLNKTMILMHSRGNPTTMGSLTSYPNGVVNGVAQELSQRVKAAIDAGIAPWRIVLDPGVGFAKTQVQNLKLLRRLDELRAGVSGGGSFDGERDTDAPQQSLAGLPWLLGTSRKGFVGKITDVADPAQRQFGTAATVAASIAGGADIVRVHDVKEMAQVAKMADAIYRS